MRVCGGGGVEGYLHIIILGTRWKLSQFHSLHVLLVAPMQQDANMQKANGVLYVLNFECANKARIY